MQTFKPTSHSTPIFKTPLSDHSAPKPLASSIKKVTRKVLPGTSPKTEQKVTFENDPELEQDLYDAALKVDKYKFLNLPPKHKIFPLRLAESLCDSVHNIFELAGAKNNFISFGEQVFMATSTSKQPLKALKSSTTCQLSACSANLPTHSMVGSAFICQDLEDVKLQHLEYIICSHHALASINLNAIQSANRTTSSMFYQDNDSGISTEQKQPAAHQEAVENPKETGHNDENGESK